MATYRTAQAAELLGVSPDTMRRWAESGRLASTVGEDGRRYFDGEDLAEIAVTASASAKPKRPRAQSTRKRFVGIVTKVAKDKVVSQIRIQAGPHRFVSL